MSRSFSLGSPRSGTVVPRCHPQDPVGGVCGLLHQRRKYLSEVIICKKWKLLDWNECLNEQLLALLSIRWKRDCDTDATQWILTSHQEMCTVWSRLYKESMPYKWKWHFQGAIQRDVANSLTFYFLSYTPFSPSNFPNVVLVCLRFCTCYFSRNVFENALT